MSTESEPRGFSHVGWWGAAIIVVLALLYVAAIATAALYDYPTGNSPPAIQNVSVGQIISNVPAYMGKSVTVNGKVAQPLSPEAVTLANEGSGDNTGLLVVGKQNALPQGLNAGDTLNVTGTLGTFNLAQIEKDSGVTLDPQKFAPYEGKPVLVAQSASKQG